MYEKPQFEAAFQLITAISHQIIKVNFKDVEAWVDKLMGQDALTDPEKRRNLDNLKTVMRQYHQMQAVLMEHGIPVRNIEHYKEAFAPAQPPPPGTRGPGER